MQISFRDLSSISSKELVKNIKKNTFRMIIMGNTLSGKSYFTKKILLPKIIDKFKLVILFSRKYNISGYEKALRDLDFDMDNLTSLSFDNARTKNIEIMEKIQKIKDTQIENERGKDDEGEPIYDDVLIIFDDIIDENLMSREDFMEIFFNFRHYNMSVIMCSQVTNKAISPQMKSNIEYNVFFRLNSSLQRAYPERVLFDAIKLRNTDLSELNDKILDKFVSELYMKWVFATDKDGVSKYQYLITDNNGNIFGGLK